MTAGVAEGTGTVVVVVVATVVVVVVATVVVVVVVVVTWGRMPANAGPARVMSATIAAINAARLMSAPPFLA